MTLTADHAVNYEVGHATLSRKAIVALRVWLSTIATLIAAMVVVGGATRLTDSGLSITEWKPLLGVIPPLSDADWQVVLEKYRQIPEYQLINKGMSMDEFKFIYWWEWGHRLLGRVIGLAFFVPLVAFWAFGWLNTALKIRLSVLFVLGGLQGVIGWWMVTSGLVERVDVSQYRLAIHLTLACLLFAGVIWVLSGLSARDETHKSRSLNLWAVGLLCLSIVQIFAGGLVAGMDAGLAYNTWPLMDGALVPGGLLAMSPFWLNAFENAKTVQFDHRMIAYTLMVLVVVHASFVWARVSDQRLKLSSLLIIAAIFGQALMGILTLLYAVPLDLALYHQFGALVVLAAIIWHLRLLKGPYAFARSARPYGKSGS